MKDWHYTKKGCGSGAYFCTNTWSERLLDLTDRVPFTPPQTIMTPTALEVMTGWKVKTKVPPAGPPDPQRLALDIKCSISSVGNNGVGV